MSSPVPGVPIQDIPALAPPQGVRPNFVNPPSREHELIILEGIFVPLMLLFVSMRLFVRARITKKWGWDDCKINSDWVEHEVGAEILQTPVSLLL